MLLIIIEQPGIFHLKSARNPKKKFYQKIRIFILCKMRSNNWQNYCYCYTENNMKSMSYHLPHFLKHPCPQQTFRFIKNGHLQIFVFQKVWYIGVTKSIKLKNFFVRFLFYGYWKFVTSQRWKKTQKLMKIEKLLNETVWKRWKFSEFCI